MENINKRINFGALASRVQLIELADFFSDVSRIKEILKQLSIWG